LILALAQHMRYVTDQRFRADGLTTQQAMALTLVGAIGRPSMSELAEAMGTSHQNIKQLAVALERKGFVKFLEDPDDARVRRLDATAKSKRYWASRDDDDFRSVGEWFEGLSAGETAQLLALLRKLATGVIGRGD